MYDWENIRQNLSKIDNVKIINPGEKVCKIYQRPTLKKIRGANLAHS